MIDWSGILHSLLVLAIAAVAGMLWRAALAIERVNTAQEAHEVLDTERFLGVHRRLDDFRDEVRHRE